MGKSLISDITDYKVSSVLNNDRKLYGKKYLFDGNDETCWNSDKGVPQWIELSFSTMKEVQQVSIQFQGGFAAKSCVLECVKDETSDSESLKKTEFHPKDSNELQTFSMDCLLTSKKFKLIINSSFDFYGRIIIYSLDILGK